MLIKSGQKKVWCSCASYVLTLHGLLTSHHKDMCIQYGRSGSKYMTVRDESFARLFALSFAL